MARFFAILALALTGPASFAKSADGELTPQQLAELWDRFGHHDRSAVDDIARMARSPSAAVPFLKQQLQPVPAPDAKRIQQYLADLDSKTFRQRENAAKELEALGQLAGPAIEAKLKEKLPLEARRRLEAIQSQLNQGRLSPQVLRSLRAIDVLYEIRTPDAVAVLEALARGADGAVQTVEARRALADLGRKP